jgi:hypothetical protein
LLLDILLLVHRPCHGTDVDTGEIFNSCCPQGMEYPFHNMCMTAKEYDQALDDEKQVDKCQAPCILGGIVSKNPGEIASGPGCDFDTSRQCNTRRSSYLF